MRGGGTIDVACVQASRLIGGLTERAGEGPTCLRRCVGQLYILFGIKEAALQVRAYHRAGGLVCSGRCKPRRVPRARVALTCTAGLLIQLFMALALTARRTWFVGVPCPGHADRSGVSAAELAPLPAPVSTSSSYRTWE